MIFVIFALYIANGHNPSRQKATTLSFHSDYEKNTDHNAAGSRHSERSRQG